MRTDDGDTRVLLVGVGEFGHVWQAGAAGRALITEDFNGDDAAFEGLFGQLGTADVGVVIEVAHGHGLEGGDQEEGGEGE